MKKVAIILAVVALGAYTNGLENKDVEELYKCETFSVDPTFDQEKANAAPYLQVPLWSKGFAYKMAQDFHTPDEFETLKLSLTELQKSCFYYKFQGTELPVYAYGKYNLYHSFPDPIRKGIRYYTSPNGTVENSVKYSYTSYITLTDSKSFFVNINTWVDGSKNFIVVGVKPVLPVETLEIIKAHLISHGFSEENFETQDYTNCTPPPAFLAENTKN